MSSDPKISSPARLMSLDVFRGLTIASMMLVNNPGSWSAVYPPFRHSEWHGWTFTDTIFPFFLWIVGVAIPLSLVRRMERGDDRGKLFLKAFRRSLILFGIGLFLNGFPFYDFVAHHWIDFSTLRFPGVLQRIAVCYLITSAIVLNTRVRGQILWTAGLLMLYCLLMAFGSMPGFPAGDLSKEGNFSHYIDHLVLKQHVWVTSKTWDPEGIVSTIPAIATCLFGVLTGQLLRSQRSSEEKTAFILVTGNLLLFAGQIFNFWLPINKPLWTSSYSLWMAGLAMNVFGVCYWLVDVKGMQRWAKPFAIYGMNAIAVFVLAGVVGRLTVKIEAKPGVFWKNYLYDNLFGHLADAKFSNPPLLSPENASLLWALMYVSLLYLVAYFLYRKKWFIRF